MAQAGESLQDTRKRQADLVEDQCLEQDQGQGEWQEVSAKKKKRQALTSPQVTMTTGPKRQRLNCFKVQASSSTDAYRKVALLNEKFPNLNMTAKPNLKSEWILTPKDQKAYDTLKNTSTIELRELHQEDKRKKAIVIGFPFDIPTIELAKHPQILHAERMKNKEGVETKTILCTFTGPVPEKVDIGIWGRYSTKTYYPEPLRCYNCQKYGHHKSACKAQVKCAVCSGSHETNQCINKHKEGQTTSPKCPNCKESHPAWHRRCPVRLNRIQAQLPKQPEEPKRSVSRKRPVPAPRTTFYTKKDMQLVRSISRSRKPQPLPRTVFISTDNARIHIKKYTKALLQSVGRRTTTENLEELAGFLLNEIWSTSTTIPSPLLPSSSTTSSPTQSSTSSYSSPPSTSSPSSYSYPSLPSTSSSFPPPSTSSCTEFPPLPSLLNPTYSSASSTDLKLSTFQVNRDPRLNRN